MPADDQRQRALAAASLARKATLLADELSDVDDSKPMVLALASIALSLSVLADQATDTIPGINVFEQSRNRR